MSVIDFLKWLHDTRLSILVRESAWGEPVLESIHVLCLTLFLGFVVLLDLRLLGICMRSRRFSEVIDQLNPWIKVGFVVMIFTGVVLFCGDPIAFYENTPLRIKILLLAVALVNIVVFDYTTRRSVSEWDHNAVAPPGARIAAILSLVLWAGIVAAGRAIAYTLPPP